jgi:hypothetical protein
MLPRFYYYIFAHFSASIILSSSRVSEHGACAALLWAPALEIAVPTNKPIAIAP